MVVSIPTTLRNAIPGIAWSGDFAPEEKISPQIGLTNRARRSDASLSFFVVEFYSDVPSDDARAIAIESGLVIIDNPDVLPNHLLVEGTTGALQTIASWDEVEYVFPASSDLAKGIPVIACAGAVTSEGPVGQAVPAIGDGWDGPGANGASLNYSFVSTPAKLPADAAKAEIVRAFNEWAKYAKLTFTETADPTAVQTLAVLFASGAHGDSYPFDNLTNIAHTFYPAPLNPEPIAGDLHFNADEGWNIGTTKDLFSVALHEAGHALGLGHSDNPDDVMYPYYKQVTGLAAGDIAAILELYAPQDDTPIPILLEFEAPPSTVATTTLALSGTVTGGTGPLQVGWSNGSNVGMMQGSATWTASIPLTIGVNSIALTATDAQKNTATTTLVVTRQAAAPAPPNTSIQITQPIASSVYTTSMSAIAIQGTATDDAGIDHVSWINSAGGSGQAAGTSAWMASSIPLTSGPNVISVTAYGKTGGAATQSISVSYTPPTPDPVPTPPPTTQPPATQPPSTQPPSTQPPSTQPSDTTAPTLNICSPSTTNAYTSSSAIAFSGYASDNVGVVAVTSTNSNGGSGTATGTTKWNTGAIPLLVGSNLITIKASDAAGNIGWRSVMVTRGQ